jgi:hypothetical protein
VFKTKWKQWRKNILVLFSKELACAAPAQLILKAARSKRDTTAYSVYMPMPGVPARRQNETCFLSGISHAPLTRSLHKVSVPPSPADSWSQAHVS